MYIYPEKHICNKCGHAFNYGPHDEWNTPVFEEVVKTPHKGTFVFSRPVCPVCWEKFILANVGVGISTWEQNYEH